MSDANLMRREWPEAKARAGELPRLEDLPVAEHGYEREDVSAAFDSFYRHIAQLDSTLRTLEAVEVFRDQAGELRRELRAVRSAGWARQPWPSARVRESAGLPEWTPRVAIEAAFLVLVAVVVVVAGFDRLSIVLVMALAWMIVGVVEWAVSREGFASKRVPATEPRRVSIAPIEHPDRADVPESVLVPSLSDPDPVDSTSPPPQPDRDDGAEGEAPVASRTRRPAVGWRPRRPSRRQVAVLALAIVAIPGGMASAALLVVGEGGRSANVLVVREKPHPRAVGPAAIGPPVREAALRTDAVVRANRGDSWLEIRADSPQGKEVYAGVLAQGRVVRARAERVWLRLGAASNVDVLVNGRPVAPLFGTVAVTLTPRGLAANP